MKIDFPKKGLTKKEKNAWKAVFLLKKLKCPYGCTITVSDILLKYKQFLVIEGTDPCSGGDSRCYIFYDFENCVIESIVPNDSFTWTVFTRQFPKETCLSKSFKRIIDFWTAPDLHETNGCTIDTKQLSTKEKEAWNTLFMLKGR